MAEGSSCETENLAVSGSGITLTISSKIDLFLGCHEEKFTIMLVISDYLGFLIMLCFIICLIRDL